MSISDLQPSLYCFMLVGDCGVGKSSILANFKNQSVSKIYTETISVGLGSRDTTCVDGTKACIRCVDTPGLQSDGHFYYDKLSFECMDAVAFVFDLTNAKSFKNIKHRLKKLNMSKSVKGHRFLVGNKLDLATNGKQQRVVTQRDVDKQARKYNMEYFEVSALKKINMSALFDRICKRCVKANHFKR